MPDIVFIKDLRIKATIGIYDWEKKIKQTLSFNLEMATDIRKAAQSDNIDDTLNYKAIAKRVIQFVEASKFELVETLAEKVCELIMQEFGVTWLRLELDKLGAVRGSKSVGVRIERGTIDS